MVDVDPLIWCAEWLADAAQAEPVNPTAVALATVDGAGHPQVRMVLLRGFDRNGFVFYTNTESPKGEDLALHPHAALCFYWKSLARQLRVTGKVEAVTPAEADAYFASRPHESQIGAWASQQSRVLDSRATLEQQVESFTQRFAAGPVPRPAYWSGYRVVPAHVEFWEERPYRLHARTLFRRRGEHWEICHLYP